MTKTNKPLLVTVINNLLLGGFEPTIFSGHMTSYAKVLLFQYLLKMHRYIIPT